MWGEGGGGVWTAFLRIVKIIMEGRSTIGKLRSADVFLSRRSSHHHRRGRGHKSPGSTTGDSTESLKVMFPGHLRWEKGIRWVPVPPIMNNNTTIIHSSPPRPTANESKYGHTRRHGADNCFGRPSSFGYQHPMPTSIIDGRKRRGGGGSRNE